MVRNVDGFTILEMLITLLVVAIIGFILSTSQAPSMRNFAVNQEIQKVSAVYTFGRNCALANNQSVKIVIKSDVYIVDCANEQSSFQKSEVNLTTNFKQNTIEITNDGNIKKGGTIEISNSDVIRKIKFPIGGSQFKIE